MHWFKTHHGYNSDAKLGLIAHNLKIPRIIVSGIFLDMLEYASKQNPRGCIDGYDPEAQALNLGIESEQIVTVRNALRNRGVLQDDEIVNWNVYQNLDKTNAERQKRYRNKQKQDVINPVTDSNALRNTDEIRIDKIRKEPPMVPQGDFYVFWKVYPKKVGRGAALKAHLKALKKASHEEIMLALSRHKFPTDKQFIPNPATWLNEERWADEQEIKKPMRANARTI